ncbi:MAG: D-glycero-beta-D-manno-heptose 1-phosphate adenylyltransferase [Bdellovibrionales bacterium]|nr:D-glycero-beta-D-manno-heptose 1-phosphate adenylyltransferase [Bdellovibrionales bacterium]
MLSPDELAQELKKLKQSSDSSEVVFTNGCFDILHPGHVTYLNQAREEGSHLVVALNSDESVRKQKGPSRPVNSLEDRQTVMAGLECVDFVTFFAEDTPLELIQKLHPDVVVKGGDWKIDQIVGAKEVMAWGGRAKSLGFVDGKSTTRIIEKASKNH